MARMISCGFRAKTDSLRPNLAPRILPRPGERKGKGEREM